jgi:putative protein kinase ArgK-like GTPase of G3E family
VDDSLAEGGHGKRAVVVADAGGGDVLDVGVHRRRAVVAVSASADAARVSGSLTGDRQRFSQWSSTMTALTRSS